MSNFGRIFNTLAKEFKKTMQNTIYHITDKTYYDAQMLNKIYYSPTFEQEKFIHLSTKKQVNSTLKNYYKGVKNLILLHINVEKLGSKLKYEAASNGDIFPHIYGPIEREAIISFETLLPDIDGNFNWIQ